MTESLQNGDLNFLYVEALVQKEAGADLVDINVCTVGVNEAEAMRDAVGLIQSMVAGSHAVKQSKLRSIGKQVPG